MPFPFANDSGGIARNDLLRLNILCNDRSRTHDCSSAYLDPGPNECFGCHPRAIPNAYRSDKQLKVAAVVVVGCCT
jgi:hypothetical protein